MVRAGSIALLAMAISPSAAAAADFADPAARVFSLASTGSVSAAAVVPGGDVVYAVRREAKPGAPGRLMRLTPAGFSRQIRADGAHLLAPETSRTVLRVPEQSPRRPSVPKVERVDLMTGKVSALARLPGRWSTEAGESQISALTVLEGGTALVAAAGRLYAIPPKGKAVRLPRVTAYAVEYGQLAPLPGRRFVFAGSEGLMIGDLSGGSRLLAPGVFVGPIADSGDGGVLATLQAADMTVVRVGTDGMVTPRLTPPERPSAALGAGDGLPLFQDQLPERLIFPRTYRNDQKRTRTTRVFALAGDGALLFAHEPRSDGLSADAVPAPDRSLSGLRALVPPSSPRPRIALTQDAFTTFAAGRLGFLSSAPGAVTVIAGTVTRGAATTPGEGQVHMNVLPPPGRYPVRVLLITSAGAVAESVETIDTRVFLPTSEAETALKRVNEQHTSDEAASLGTQVVDCRRTAARVIRCLVRFYDFGVDLSAGPRYGWWSRVTAPEGWATATLREDGTVQTTREPLPGFAGALEPCLRVTADRRQDAPAVVATIHTRCDLSLRVTARLRWRTRSRAHRRTITVARPLRAEQTWRPALRIPKSVSRAVEAGRRVSGEIVLHANRPTPYGPTPEDRGIPIEMRR